MLRWSYKRQLIDDEVLVKCVHQHWRVVTLPIVYTILLMAILLTIVFTVLDTSWGLALLGLTALVGLAAWCAFALPPLARWYAESYAVTSRRVLSRVGVFHRHHEQVDLVGVPNPMLDRSVVDVLFRSGTLDLGGGRVMPRIPRAVRMVRLISQLAANQNKDAKELTRLLRAMGYSNLTSK